jgi:hypothetical protein
VVLLRFLLFTSIVPAAAAVAGALAGMPFGRRTMFVLATIAGTFGVLAMVRFGNHLGWVHPQRQRGVAIGGLVGLGLGAPVAAMTLDRPLAIVIGALLVGVGALAGGGTSAAQ